ncbi:hypothetical protein CVT24_007728 [Panaeolus cyanescens]|uniref:Transcription elongation factor Spt6 n=1 Tax=Panaeolus cyanescens TaxID=181874 RepID=A0A409YKQ8_9AGAR|nr:hypothetical protein CVT24_007728 [Panaeolus cyanescens]
MSSLDPHDFAPQHELDDVDDPMRGSGQEEEPEADGDVNMGGGTDDSSEEGEDDEEEMRRVTEGFIVDEDDEEEEEEDAPKRKRKRRKKHHRNEELEEDDIELLKENTRGSFKQHRRLTRWGGNRDSQSPPATSSAKRRTIVESSDEDLDNDEGSRQAQDISNIWADDEDLSEDDFIDDSDESATGMNEEARAARREERRQENLRRKRARVRPELVGIDANAWDEIHEVFGDGHEYDWALVGDDELEYEEEVKPDMRYQDVFEPSEIRRRFLTEDDDLIRVQDVPERMQLASSSLSTHAGLSMHSPLTEENLGGAAMWVTEKLSVQKTVDFLTPGGKHETLQGALVMAVTFTLRKLFIEDFEVPYIWAHKRDYICHFDPQDIGSRSELLTLNELWRIYTLGQKYRSLLERKKALSSAYERLRVKDDYYEEEIQPQMDSVELVADATEWLNMKYKDKKLDNGASDFRFHDDEPDTSKRKKMPSRVSVYELTKKSVVSKLAEGFGLAPHHIVLNFLSNNHDHFIEDQELIPLVYAERFVDPDPLKAQPTEELLRRARLIISTELGKDPLLRNQIRQLFKANARLTVEPTERGITKIDENHPYFNFKYLSQKPIGELLDGPQFLHMLAAEAEHLINIVVTIPPDVKATFERRLLDAFSSDSFTDAARSWNAERLRVVQEVIDQHLIPAAVKWTREFIREEVEDLLAARCGEKLRKRLDVAPYMTRELKYGEYASSVLAVSWGKGNPQKDAITLVFMDELGRMREQTKVDNLHDQENVDEFVDFLRRRRPDVVVVGGFTVATLKLMHRVKEIVRGPPPEAQVETSNTQAFNIPVEWVHDDVARIFQHSKRATDEFSSFSPTARYCVGLARYVQSPLNEFAALGGDVTAISFDEDNQNLIPTEKLLVAFEQALVDITNKVGVDINRATNDHYYAHLLPFVCGLGPRKAQVLVQKILSQGGTIVNRDQFIKNSLLSTKIFLNAVAFLRVMQDRDMRSHKYRPDDENMQDPLDDTRIHPEDYDLARKMATDALELDEEDIHDEHPSHTVTTIMNDTDKDRKLAELNLDDFAVSLYEANRDQKRHTLNVIRGELVKPFAESRNMFLLPTDWEIITMLTGETQKTLGVGLIVSVMVMRIQREVVHVRLDSGVEGLIAAEHLEGGQTPMDAVKKGQTLTAIVIALKFMLDHDEFFVGLSTRKKDLAEDDRVFRRVDQDRYWDDNRYSRDIEMLARKKRAETDRSRRVIKHPNFHNFNAAQAESYLEKQQRGDVVIRPSSKGSDHLAVTWKVDDRLYQHIDVTETSSDPSSQTIAGQLIVDQNHVYSDLDELIVNHVQAMARRVEELMAHEKFKRGSEDELHLSLKNFLAANPAKSMYGFTLNRKRPGHFNLCFLANKNSMVQSWPVRVAPEAYYLFDAAAVGVPELCDAFKVRHLHESQTAAATAGGKTPFGAGMRTPGRPGGATPGHMSIRQPARTPNPYGAGSQTPFGMHGHPQAPPHGYGPQPTPYGYQTPAHRPPVFNPAQPPIPPNPNAPRPQSAWGRTWS